MEPTFAMLQEHLQTSILRSHKYVLEPNEQEGIHIKRNGHDTTIHYVPCYDMMDHFKKHHQFEGLIYRQTLKKSGIVEREWFKALVYEEETLYELIIIAKTEGDTLSSDGCSNMLDKKWNNKKQVYFKPFDELKKQMLAWIGELPEYRLHVLTKGWSK